MLSVRRVLATSLIAACAAVVGFPAIASPAAAAGESAPPLTAAQAKAGFIYNLAMFVQWPADASGGRDIHIGIVGGDPFGGVIDEMRNREVNGRVIRIKHVRDDDDLRPYHILFVAGDDRQTDRVLTETDGMPVLTIGERSDFATRGGVIRVYVEQARLRFEVNADRAEGARLRISSKLLGLAKVVRDEDAARP